MDKTRAMTIYFNDGTNLSFAFPEQSDRTALDAITRMEEYLKYDHVMVEADGTLLTFPYSSIKYLEIHPAPTTLPAQVIRGARIADQ